MKSTLLVELSSKEYVRSVSISNESHDRVFFEGNLGTLLQVSIIDKQALEIIAENGVFRVDIRENVLQEVLNIKSRVLDLTSDSVSKVNV